MPVAVVVSGLCCRFPGWQTRFPWLTCPIRTTSEIGEGPSKYELLGPSGLTGNGDLPIDRSAAQVPVAVTCHRGELPRRADHLLRAIPLSPKGVRSEISTPAVGLAQGVFPCGLGEFLILGVSSTDQSSSSTGRLLGPQVAGLSCGFADAGPDRSGRDPEAGSGVTQG